MLLKFKTSFTIFAVFVLFLYGLALMLGGNEGGTFLADFIFLIAPFLAFVVGFWAIKLYGTKNIQGKSFLFLTLSMVFLFLGEVFWFYLEYIKGVEPDYSIADIFFIASYPLSFLGILIKLKSSNISFFEGLKSIFRKKCGICFFLFLIVAFILVSYFGIFKVYDSEISLLENIIFMFYGVGDLIIILGCSFIAFLILELRGGKFSHAWLLLAASYFFILIADILYAIYYDSLYEEILFFNMTLNIFWMVGYFLFAAAMLYFVLILKEKKSEILGKINDA